VLVQGLYHGGQRATAMTTMGLELPRRRPVPRQIPQPPAGRARQNQEPQSGLRGRRSGAGRHRGHRPRLLVERVGLRD